MPGLFSQQPQAAAPPQSAAPPPPAQPMPATKQQPQGQGDSQGFKRFLANVLNTVYNDKTTPAIIERLKSSQDPASDLAQIAVQAIVRVEDSAQQNGVPVDKNVILQSGAEVLGDIAELSSQFGGHEFSDEEIQQAFLRGVDLYRTIRQGQGKIDPKAAQAELQQLNAAGESGQLEQQYPGMSEMIAKMSAGKQGGAEPESPPSADQEEAVRFDTPHGNDKGASKPSKTRQNGYDSSSESSGAKPQGQFKRKGQRKKGKR